MGLSCVGRAALENRMSSRTHFVIFKSDTRYSITECSNSGIRQAFLNDGRVSGDESVLLRLSKAKPENITMESFVERNAGHLIFETGGL